MRRPTANRRAGTPAAAAPSHAPGTGRHSPGFTLVELIVTMMLLSIVMAAVIPTLVAVTGSITTSGQVLTGEAQARLAIQNLEIQVASASEICLPTQFTTAGFTLRILQVLSTTTSGGSLTTTYRWDQWMVATGTSVLEEEDSANQSTTSSTGISWPKNSNGSAAWVPVSHYMVNSSTPPFSLLSTSKGSPQALSVDLQVSDGTGHGAQVVTMQSTIAALDTPYVLSPSACSTATPDQ
jgi:prepilin-type N-terminal cleavage/methylation domain-containing protein